MNWKTEMFRQDVKPFSSMDDLSLYGPRKSSYSHRQAVLDKIIVPSQFIICEDVEDEAADWIESDEDVELESESGEIVLLTSELRKAYAVMCVATRTALSQLIIENPSLKMLSFHSRIPQAEHAVDTTHPLCIIPRGVQVWTGVYHSGLSPQQKRRVLRDFEQQKGPAILTCVKAIREGINIPSIDCTIHMRTYGSEDDSGVSVDLIQHIGRGVRWSKNKELCFHVFPLVPAGVSIALRGKVIEQIVDLMEQHELLPEMIEAIQRDGRITVGTLQRFGFSVKLPTHTSEQELVDAITLQVLDFTKNTNRPLYKKLSMQQAVAKIRNIVRK